MKTADGAYSNELVEFMPRDLFEAAVDGIMSLPTTDLVRSYSDLRDKGVLRATDRRSSAMGGSS